MNFKKVRDVRLNRGGKKIGIIAIDRYGRKCYVTYREPGHYFILFHGFGIDKTLIKKLLEDKIDHIYIVYKGKRGEKIYYSNMDKWIMKGQPYGTAKEVEDDVETYGEQLILPTSQMKVG